MASVPPGYQQFLVPGTVVDVDATPKGYNTIEASAPPYVFRAAGSTVHITIEHRGGESPIVYSCTGGREIVGVKATEAPETTKAAGTTSEPKAQ